MHRRTTDTLPDTDGNKDTILMAADSVSILNLLNIPEKTKKADTDIKPETSKTTVPSNTSPLAQHSVFTPKKTVSKAEIETLKFRHFYFHYL